MREIFPCVNPHQEANLWKKSRNGARSPAQRVEKTRTFPNGIPSRDCGNLLWKIVRKASPPPLIDQDSRLLWGNQLVSDATPAYFPSDQRDNKIHGV